MISAIVEIIFCVLLLLYVVSNHRMSKLLDEQNKLLLNSYSLSVQMLKDILDKAREGSKDSKDDGEDLQDEG